MTTDTRTSRVVEPLFQLWSHVYDARVFQRFYGSIHDRILARAPAEVSAALDVGCGTGELVVKLARRYPRARVVGVDISAAMLRQARGKSYGDAHVELVEGSVYSLPFPDATFELVTNTISSHFYRDFAAAARELARVAAPGARLAMASLGNGVLRHLPGAAGKEVRVGEMSYRAPSHQRAMLESAGWSVERVDRLLLGAVLYTARRRQEA
jgi:ubiquinone/menaquinone biosynthesis C-methylase UbiE